MAISDEDLERTNDTKTSSVHFMRFELAKDMIDEIKNGNKLIMGVEQSVYTHSVELSEEFKNSLINDLD